MAVQVAEVVVDQKRRRQLHHPSQTIQKGKGKGVYAILVCCSPPPKKGKNFPKPGEQKETSVFFCFSSTSCSLFDDSPATFKGLKNNSLVSSLTIVCLFIYLSVLRFIIPSVKKKLCCVIVIERQQRCFPAIIPLLVTDFGDF